MSGLRETSEGGLLVQSQRTGLSCSDSALFDRSPCHEGVTLASVSRTSLDLETASSRGDSEEAVIAQAWSKGAATKGCVFFIQEPGKLAASRLYDAFYGSRRNVIQEPDTGGNQKRRKKKSAWKKLFPSGLMRRGGRTGDFGSSKNELGTKNVVIAVGDNWQEVAQFGLEALGIVAGGRGGIRGETETVVVKGLVPDSAADRTQQIAAGDHLVSVNDKPITNDTVTDVLQGLSGTDKLVFKSVRPKSTLPQVTLRRHLSTTTPALVRLLNGSPTPVWQSSMSSMPHALMYLSLNTSGETEDSQQTVVYRYPEKECEWAWSEKIVALRGAFLTLSDLMKEVTGGCANTSTLEIDGQLVHIAYRQLERDILILALPADKVHIHSVTQFLDDFVSLLSLLYDSVPKAFSGSASVQRLNHMFSLVFENVLSSGESGYVTRLNSTLHGVPRLPIHAELLGYLLDSHLSDSDTQAVSLYCRYHCLLSVSQKQRVGLLVVWSEVFLPVDPVQSPVYQQLKGRTFLLIVGLGQTLVCMLLDCGGTTGKVRGHPGPDPLYIDLAQQVVVNLNTRGLLDACETRIQSTPVPHIVQVDDIVSPQRPSSASTQTKASARRPHSVAFGMDVEDLGSPYSSNWKRHVTEQAGDLASVRQRSQTVTGEKRRVHYSLKPGSNLVPGGSTVIFHYVTVNSLSGIVISPVQGAFIGGHLHSAVVRNFCKACISIRHVLVKQSEVPTSLTGVYEHGLLMQCPNQAGDKQKTSLCYWVVGRLMKIPVPREFYVCFYETVHHDIVEMVFRLTLGATT